MRKSLGQEFRDARESMSNAGNHSPPVPVERDRFPPLAHDKEPAEREPVTHDVHVGDTVHMPKGDCFEVKGTDDED